MKRFTLSTFSVSALSVLAAAGAISLGEGLANAPSAQALPRVNSDFNLQTVRLSEFDTRNKSEDYPQPSYPQTSTQYPVQEATNEQENIQATEQDVESIEWETPAIEEEATAEGLSIVERRHQSLDRS